MDHYCFAAAAARRFTLFIQEAKLDLYETLSIYGLFQAFLSVNPRQSACFTKPPRPQTHP